MNTEDIIVLYTDGVTEAINENDEQFGEDRLTKVIRENRKLPVEEIIQEIRNELDTFTGSQPQFDDITLMILKVKG